MLAFQPERVRTITCRLFAPRIHLCPGLLESPLGPPGWAGA